MHNYCLSDCGFFFFQGDVHQSISQFIALAISDRNSTLFNIIIILSEINSVAHYLVSQFVSPSYLPCVLELLIKLFIFIYIIIKINC